MEKVIDFLVGDGINSRYGMVCKECFGHNGTKHLLITVLLYSAFVIMKIT